MKEIHWHNSGDTILNFRDFNLSNRKYGMSAKVQKSCSAMWLNHSASTLPRHVP
ncbi:hypothetical protein KsCSTR_00870 [Candidatus Kuenenia stuttgartiensis]|uniref:Uncharacterized protein n=1 Tax=Kuenenia stuttgartiensis TaxID=174633 RepID=Q1PV46_KUEST|nr:hypothetical protein KsCSTR_00870 [Candidatus Kuenenia stuttgartiensis]CAJ71107.1 unknown protein [Candidatus Kuenenia stuttgartiensis]